MHQHCSLSSISDINNVYQRVKLQGGSEHQLRAPRQILNDWERQGNAEVLPHSEVWVFRLFSDIHKLD